MTEVTVEAGRRTNWYLAIHQFPLVVEYCSGSTPQRCLSQFAGWGRASSFNLPYATTNLLPRFSPSALGLCGGLVQPS